MHFLSTFRCFSCNSETLTLKRYWMWCGPLKFQHEDYLRGGGQRFIRGYQIHQTFTNDFHQTYQRLFLKWNLSEGIIKHHIRCEIYQGIRDLSTTLFNFFYILQQKLGQISTSTNSRKSSNLQHDFAFASTFKIYIYNYNKNL